MATAITSRYLKLLALLTCIVLVVIRIHAADPIPERVSDSDFRALIETISEPGGTFLFENIISNEPYYADLVRDLSAKTSPGGIFIGVGPEQNFNYIAGLRPRMVFIVDIRRQNMIEQLMYKALFEVASTRTDFLSRLFSRSRPANLKNDSSIAEIMQAYSDAPSDSSLLDNVLKETRSRIQQHGFSITAEDDKVIERVLRTFAAWGVNTRFGSTPTPPLAGARGSTSSREPTYAAEMTAADSTGVMRSFMSSEENYSFVRDMELRNVIIPVVGDFAGPQALRAIGDYLRSHNATVSVFYVSNVETYFFPPNINSSAPNGGWKNFIGNVSALPVDESSMFVRFMNVTLPGRLDRIADTLAAEKAGRIKVLADLFTDTNK
jgi:hypothetical protein